jgi:hypothetical protein
MAPISLRWHISSDRATQRQIDAATPGESVVAVLQSQHAVVVQACRATPDHHVTMAREGTYIREAKDPIAAGK